MHYDLAFTIIVLHIGGIATLNYYSLNYVLEEETNIILFLVVGLIAGWLAGVIMKGKGFGMLGYMIIGIIGAFIGGYLFRIIGLVVYGLISIIMAFVGAVILLFIIGLINKS